jgi:DNA modification methylase
MDGLKEIQTNSIDCIITDPPFTFGIGSSMDNEKIDNWTDLMNSSFFFRELLLECKRVCKQDSVFWIFNSWRSYPCLLKALCMANLSADSLLIWYKDWIGPGGPKGLRPSYEMVVLVCNGNYGIPNRGIEDVQRFKWSSHKPNHPAEKPLNLVRWLIEISGDVKVILDPFIGSGTTAVACKQLDKHFIGFELNPNYYDLAIKRIANVSEKLESYVPMYNVKLGKEKQKKLGLVN